MVVPPGIPKRLSRELETHAAWARSVWQPDLRVWDNALARSCGILQNIERSQCRVQLRAYLKEVIAFEVRTKHLLPNYLDLFELVVKNPDQPIQWTPLSELQMDVVSSATGIFFHNGAPVVMSEFVGRYAAPSPASPSVVDSSPAPPPDGNDGNDGNDDDDDDDLSESSELRSSADSASSSLTSTGRTM